MPPAQPPGAAAAGPGTGRMMKRPSSCRTRRCPSRWAAPSWTSIRTTCKGPHRGTIQAWFKVQFPGDASVKSLQKKSLRAIPEGQAAAPRTPAPPPAAAAPDYEFDVGGRRAGAAPGAGAALVAGGVPAGRAVGPRRHGARRAAAGRRGGGAAAAAGRRSQEARRRRAACVPAAPAAPAGVILPLAGAPPAGAPIRVRTAGGREAIVLEKMQRGWFRV